LSGGLGNPRDPRDGDGETFLLTGSVVVCIEDGKEGTNSENIGVFVEWRHGCDVS
jgi:hypothetical protein